MELHAGHGSEIEVNPEGVTLAVQEKSPSQRKHISELAGNEENIEILATITQVFDLRFFANCPDCNKRLVQREGKEACLEHGDVEPQFGCVLNLILDDGTGSVRCAFWRKQAERLLEKQDLTSYKNQPELFENAKTQLLGEQVKVVGRAKKNDMFDRIEFSAQLVLTPDPKEEIQKT